MLEALFGSTDPERVLIFLNARGEGYARQIAAHYGTSPSGIQRQIEKLEAAGVIAGRQAGRTRLYTFNPRWLFLRELRPLLDKMIAFLPAGEREGLTMNRRRPRRAGKPL